LGTAGDGILNLKRGDGNLKREEGTPRRGKEGPRREGTWRRIKRKRKLREGTWIWFNCARKMVGGGSKGMKWNGVIAALEYVQQCHRGIRVEYASNQGLLEGYFAMIC